jgi:hypothetical protein
MLPVTFPGCNSEYVAPEGWTAEQCSNCPSMLFYCASCLCMHILIKMNFSLEDLNAVNKSLPIFIEVIGEQAQPFTVFAEDVQLQVNFQSRGINGNKQPYELFYIIPTKKQLKEINNSGSIYYQVAGDRLQPFFMFTVDEQGNGNY